MKKVSGWTSLASFPSNICVDGQNKHEKVLLFVREHKVTLFFNIFAYSIVLVMPFLIRFAITYLNNTLLEGFINISPFFNSNWWKIIIIVWFAYVFTGYFNIFFRWFYNINILTTERFVDIDFINIFENRVESAAITDVEDVKEEQAGLFQSIFNMGDLTLLTASGGTAFSLDNVPKAHKIRDFIQDVAIKMKDKKGNSND